MGGGGDKGIEEDIRDRSKMSVGWGSLSLGKCQTR